MVFGKLKIMIVEDDISFQKLIGKILRTSGFEVIGSKSNGVEALEFISSNGNKPDIIILDYSMPVMDGIETLKKIRETDKETKIIMLSAHNEKKDLALYFGANKYLQKPITLKELIKEIMNLFNN